MLDPPRQTLGAWVKGKGEGDDGSEARGMLAKEGAEGVQEGEQVGW